MQCLLHGWLRQAKSLLHEVDAQHGDNCKRRASRLARGGAGLNQHNQFCPRHNQIHIIKEFTLSCPQT